MASRLSELAALVGGNLIGTADPEIIAASTLQLAEPGHITFIDNADKLPLLFKARAAATVVPAKVVPEVLPAIQVDDVHAAFATIVSHFRPSRPRRRIGISPAAHVSSSARLARDVDVHPGATIGDDVEIGARSTIYPCVHVMADCKLGEGVTIFPNAVLYENTVVGDRTVVHAGAVLGSFGFGYEQVDGRHRLCAQLGWVEVGTDVEIGAGTTIDRGTYGPTQIGEGTKIDNQVQIAHNCRIGPHNMIVSQVGIAGSTSTGRHVVIAGQVGVRDHVHIGDRAILGAMSGITNDVPSESCMLGIPATPVWQQRVKQAALSRLPEMRRKLKLLTSAVSDLREQMADIQESASGTSANRPSSERPKSDAA